jgi:hypothetical protein
MMIKNSFSEMLGSLLMNKKPSYNISYPASSATVVFGVHLSALAAYRLDSERSRKPPNAHSLGCYQP